MQAELLRVDQSRSPEERPRPDRSRSDCPVLLSQRLVLRKPHEEDIDALAHLANNANVATMVSRMPHPYTTADAADFVRRAKAGTIGKCVYAITKADNGAFLGCCGIEPHPDGKTAELGYWLGEPHWGKGYMTEAVKGLLEAAHSSGLYALIGARALEENAGSIKVLEKAGFKRIGKPLVVDNGTEKRRLILFELEAPRWT
jgi:RimJ/RimL family protein N-acetyltransferase